MRDGLCLHVLQSQSTTICLDLISDALAELLKEAEVVAPGYVVGPMENTLVSPC
jgi:hypothetical protein